MITVSELLDKAKKQFLKIATDYLQGGETFPYRMPVNKKISGNSYSEWQQEMVPLHQESKSFRKYSYSVEWREKRINGTKQNVPCRIYFETLEDFLSFTKKENDFKKIIDSYQKITDAFPNLKIWATNNVLTLLNYSHVWDDLIKVCKYFSLNPPPHPYYVRELPIEVHSKFIEDHASILRKLLDQILLPDLINSQETNFATRYSLKQASIYTQIRALDDALKPHLGYDECKLPLEDAAWIKWLPKKVFIIENKVCFLTFPKVESAIAIFGEGFKSAISKHIPWLNYTKLYCWFDLDSAGFEMLNMVRTYYPTATSLLMDRKTYDKHINFAVENKSYKKELLHLSPQELDLYHFLTSNNKRLEQERISHRYVQDFLLLL